jgi:hypothetical protein
MASDDFGEKAFPVRRQMSDNDEHHPWSRRHRLEEIFQRAKTAGRRANPDDCKGGRVFFGNDRQFHGPNFARD